MYNLLETETYIVILLHIQEGLQLLENTVEIALETMASVEIPEYACRGQSRAEATELPETGLNQSQPASRGWSQPEVDANKINQWDLERAECHQKKVLKTLLFPDKDWYSF